MKKGTKIEPYWCDDPRCKGYNSFHTDGTCHEASYTEEEINEILKRYHVIVKILKGGE